MKLTSDQQKLLAAFILEDRRWRRHTRIRYARSMRNKFKHGVIFREDKRYDETFWNAVLHLLNYDEKDQAWRENDRLTPWSYQPPQKDNHAR